ncbi:MAG: PAS domain-containing protein [Spirochaetota bacterium]
MNETKTILLVEDEALIAMSEAALLEKHGYRVEIAYTAEEAVRKAAAEAMDLILMDIDLGRGKTDGTEAAQKILEVKEIPVVFLSSHTEPEIVEKTEKITSYGYVVKDSGEMVLLISIKMAFRLYEAKRRERESRQLFQGLYANMPVGSAVYEVRGDGSKGSDYIVKDFNRASLNMEGKSREDVLGKSLADLRPNIDEYGLIPILKKVWETGAPGFLSPKLYEDHKFANYYENYIFKISTGEVVTVYSDVTDYYYTERALQREMDIFQLFIDHLPDSVFFKDELHRFVRVNRAKAEEQGVEIEDMIGKTDFDFFERDIAEQSRADDEYVLRTGEPVIDREERIISGRTERWRLTTKLPIRNVEGKITGTMGVSRDISARKRAERKLKKANEELEEAVREKGFLMKELNHRIKNNLLMISALIRLKQSNLEGVDLSDIEHQIDAIRIVHEKLETTEEVTHIDFRGYVQDLVTTIFSSFAGKAVNFENRITDIRLTTRKAIPLGLIINELAVNTIQHGCSSEEECRFGIEMHADPAGGYDLAVWNTGNPFPGDVDLENPDTLGLRLITALVRQLGGTIELERTPTPRFTIRFPKDEE